MAADNFRFEYKKTLSLLIPHGINAEYKQDEKCYILCQNPSLIPVILLVCGKGFQEVVLPVSYRELSSIVPDRVTAYSRN